ncbi:ABC transporter substrate-binding protein [Sinomonas sp. JGH33]|uniref:ABC transporter substrate-binding protein n=1 Tax=Sinomonas terricola TaxID=3110330 RepID=A0ABU5TAR8_9MICC|nr:ABC transporter substrate-binding protein [Sinomonas sp. JGH33]MEA5456782.1 ABC transporter substrate-binding protein [Sinomonas sp. JGH33]
MKLRTILTGAAAAAVLALASGCASNPLAASSTGTTGGGQKITVGSANFSENVILGEVYAKALENAGYTVERKLNVGAREVLYGQVQNCSVDVVPEYNQALLAFVAPSTQASGTSAVDAALSEALPSNLGILDSSAAQDNNAVAVKNSTALQHGLKTIEDLAKVSTGMTFGGPTEWKTRADGYAGLQKDYNVQFKEYKLLDYSGPITISALDKGDVDAALLFSTVPQIKSNGYTILDDPKNAIGVNNVTPLICKNAVPENAQSVLDAVSKALSTDALISMNAAYSLDHRDASDVAAEWVGKQNLK